VVGEIAARVDSTFAVTVETDLPDSAVVTANDGIRSVVDNLLENAVEHNDADDPQVSISVRVAADTVVFTVTDNGPGIPEAIQQSIFEPSEAGSSGGLSLVYTLVSGYGGDVRIEDAEQGGSRVVVTLPRDDA
jgi:signal transduction histidine kinase